MTDRSRQEESSDLQMAMKWCDVRTSYLGLLVECPGRGEREMTDPPDVRFGGAALWERAHLVFLFSFLDGTEV
jgi:hypothetical protein